MCLSKKWFQVAIIKLLISWNGFNLRVHASRTSSEHLRMFVILRRQFHIKRRQTYWFYLNPKDTKTPDANSFRILSYAVCNSDMVYLLKKFADIPCLFILQIIWRVWMHVCSRANDRAYFVFFAWTEIHDHGTTIVTHWSANVLLWQLASQ